MSFDRVNYADTRVYVNDVLLTGVSSCEINTSREVEPVRSILHYENENRVLKSDQKPEVTISWTFGEKSSDPFFDFQNSGILSVENFNIKKKDIFGVHEIKSGFLVSYSVNAAVGSLVTAEAQYEANAYSYSSSGKLTLGNQTSDYYQAFLPSKIQLYSSFNEGDIFNFPIQSFQITIPIPRKTIKNLGEIAPKYKIPSLPTDATINFSAIKNNITGIDFSKIVLDTGDFQFLLKDCQGSGITYDIKKCSLIGVSESLDLDGNSIIDFNYVSSITNNTISKY